MIKHFIQLELKKLVRASYFQQVLVMKIIVGLGVFCSFVFAFFFGIKLLDIVKEITTYDKAINKVNTFLVYWFLFDMILRFFMQNIKVINVKPLLLMPVKTKAIIHYFLIKTLFSPFNFFPILIIVPFSLALLGNGYNYLSVCSWCLSVAFITFSINYLNILINKSNTWLLIIVMLLALSTGFKYDVSQISEAIFTHLFYNPILLIIPFLLVIILYCINYNLILKRFYLDYGNSKKANNKNESKLTWVNHFGEVAPFLKNDFRLIWRNKKPKQQVIMGFMTIFYGLIFCLKIIFKEFPAMIVFTCVIVTGGFLLTFAQLIPSWDSEYYKMLMSQKFTYRLYLKSKWYLMSLAVIFFLFLSTPYIYFGWDKFLIIVSGALFNIGINSFFTLYIGAFNKMPITLNIGVGSFDTNGFNTIQIFLGSLKFILPVVIFYIPYFIFDFYTGIVVLGVSGILGIMFRNFILNFIVNLYKKRKYETIIAFTDRS